MTYPADYSNVENEFWRGYEACKAKEPVKGNIREYGKIPHFPAKEFIPGFPYKDKSETKPVVFRIIV